MRALLFELRAGALESEGLTGALEKHVAMVRHRSGLQVDLQAPTTCHLPAAHEETLYRVVQEALSNVVKHARATRASVVIMVQDGCASVQVEDDGVGFDAAGPPIDSFGLVGMRERASRLGGTLRVGNRPEGGAVVHAELPLPEEAS
jgi:two-component system sensor histidine kinase UhpB